MEKELLTEVTKALTNFISESLNSLKWFDYPVRVTSRHPLGCTNETALGLNLYLYRISRNISFRTPMFRLRDSQILAQAEVEYLTIEQVTNLWMSLGCS